MYIREKITKQIKTIIGDALNQTVESGALTIETMPDLFLEIPREKEHGEYSTNIAMQLPKQTKKAPRFIAETLVANMQIADSYIESIEIAGPGFINFKLKPYWQYAVLAEVADLKADYGRSQKNAGKKFNLEFISANPTGPMHMGNARGGAIGDILAAVADWTGYAVTREFYINDAGNQIVKFGDSLDARYRQLMGEDIPFPEDGYQGEDITDHMKAFIAANGDVHRLLTPEERKPILIDYALNKNLSQMRSDLEAYGIRYDVWFSEQSLYDSGAIEKTIELLGKGGFTYEQEGALWFKATEFGSDKDDVLIRANGLPTYFMADIAYHMDKFINRGFDRCINVWGADHHGHVARLKGALTAVGIDASNFEVVIMQLVRLLRNGEVARMSKRQGKAIALTDLIDEVGVDATRFFFNLRSPDSHFDFDLDLAIEQSNDNPVFYVQYAHARICSIIRQMTEELDQTIPLDYSRLVEKEELNLMEILANFPDEILTAEDKLDPSRITRYAIDLAAAFHSFYNACHVRVDDKALMKARVALIEATKQVIQNALGILGVSAPERM
ncbi:arginine--tRNA ligase [Acetobacterium wieringae]|jgi:arginyl-tRNA synthetase|uniref:Arginine--tRNA ligase n=1 Tax=Acetobacterium wieringae TaxID=52694 RepID=A0A1F2PLS1_9FIRM|nr:MULTISPECIES: arginine--tRNA ligase [Acetobacterium]MEA4804275.1 arginine--tRNA ligase [Acetobacterium wieringae]OFV72380.1 arginine--tRNA ligase [Acetobacterium wieringae]UYO63207.1 arginine--tRNA ligase [Acetobacterium wieringae]VUZ23784.1 Arginine--tRNA ligase [Acetobacterium wieringae]